MILMVWKILKVTSLYTDNLRELTLKFSYLRMISSGLRDLFAAEDLLTFSS